MVHATVDIDGWIGRYPLDAHLRALDAGQVPAFRYKAPDDIFSPRHLALTEQMRRRAGWPTAGGVPADVLLPAYGEPERRDASKIGGLPYLARASWPVDGAGRPLSFVGQVCLADSMDLLRPGLAAGLPGDVLMVFQEGGEMIWSEGEGTPLHFRWARAGSAGADLVQAGDVPEQAVAWTPTHFERHRTVEFAGEPRSMDWGPHRIEAVGCYYRSKVGGIPVWQQSGEEAAGLGEFFAALHSITPGRMSTRSPMCRCRRGDAGRAGRTSSCSAMSGPCICSGMGGGCGG